MININVYKNAYEGYTYYLNGQGKQAVKSFTNMYKEGLANPTQAKFDIERAHKKASSDYDSKTKNSELKTIFNCMKSYGRTFVDYIFNKEYRNAEDTFHNEYNKLYPRTSFIRDMIIAERNMP